jgi:hypothetical protein
MRGFDHGPLKEPRTLEAVRTQALFIVLGRLQLK